MFKQIRGENGKAVLGLTRGWRLWAPTRETWGESAGRSSRQIPLIRIDTADSVLGVVLADEKGIFLFRFLNSYVGLAYGIFHATGRVKLSLVLA